MALRLGLFYVAALFPLAFLLGALRTVVLVPLTGPIVGVLIELPVILSAAYVLCRALLRSAPRLTVSQAALMGAVAFTLLMVAELVLAVTLFDMRPAAFLASFGSPHGLMGLLGQIAFAALPLWMRSHV